MKTANLRLQATTNRSWAIAFSLIALLFNGTAIAAQNAVYKTTNADGTVIFTDKPVKNGQVIKPSKLNVLIKPKTKKDAQSDPNSGINYDRPDDRVTVYDGTPFPKNAVTSVSIAAPSNEQTLVNPQGQIIVSLSTGKESRLPEGFVAIVNMNGYQVGSSTNNQVSIPVPHRGEHQLQAMIYNPAGDMSAKSKPITVHVFKSIARKTQ